MNIETEVTAFHGRSPLLAAHADLIQPSFAPLNDLAHLHAEIASIFDELVRLGDRATIERARKLKQRLNDIEPAVTMIGQVKAGKTAVVNAMVGMPGLLPSDVNPWTSVVTSLHLDPRSSTALNRARFEFLNRADWDRLVKGGGRIGELARRAGAESELSRVTDQVAKLREKSRQRLGKKFEMLLGQDHDYGYFDAELIERYVCLGDTFETDSETSRERGRFADITKAAHIHMAHNATPTRLCIRDTPGVNDTFLVREQITMKAIRGSQLCVVVLAAHQALSTVDLAMIRLISNLKSRDVIIFVNRIDELADPARQVPEIEDSILSTLKAHQGPADAQILFGSAKWAHHALTDTLKDMDSSSADALLNLTPVRLADLPEGAEDHDIVWHLSGMPALQRAIAERVAGGAGKAALDALARSARNMLNGLKATDLKRDHSLQNGPRADLDADAAMAEFAKLETARAADLTKGLEKLHADFEDRIARVHDGYLDRATTALIQHLDTDQNAKVWSYDPTGLRMLLRSSYRAYAKRANDLIQTTFATSTEEMAAFFEGILGLPAESYELAPPAPQPAPEPVILGKTIALDLQSNWWAQWWQKHTSAKAQTEKFRDLIAKETAPILDALKTEYAGAIRDHAQAQWGDMIEEQRQVLQRIIEGDTLHSAQSAKRAARAELVDRALGTLDQNLTEDA